MRNLRVLIFLFFCFLIQFSRLFFVDKAIDYLELSITITIVFLSLFAFLCYREKYKEGAGQAFRVSYLFLIGFLIVHFQMYIDYLLGNYENFKYDYFFSGIYITKASIISSLGLISFFFGYVVSVGSVNPIRKSTYSDHKSVIYLKILTFLFLILFVYFANKIYFAGGYGSIELSKRAVHAQTFLFYSITAVISVKTYQIKISETKLTVLSYLSNIGWFFNLVVLFYLFLVLISGDRGPILQTGLLYFAGFIFSQNVKVKAIYLVALVFSASLLVTFLGEFRSITSEFSYAERISYVNKNAELREKNSSFSPSTHELSISVRAVHAAMDYVDKNSFGFGLIQLNQLIAIIPGAGTVIRDIFDLKNDQLISADIITSHLEADHGLGTSTITDLYLDLGVPGVIFGLLIFGIVLRKVDVVSITPYVTGLFFWIVIMVLISKSVYIGRSSIMILCRDIITIYLLVIVFGGARKR